VRHLKVIAYVREDLKGYTGMQEQHELELKQGASALEVALLLGLPEVDIRLYVVNNTNVAKTKELHSGDIVEFYPLITGG